jgi:hypothetical protein
VASNVGNAYDQIAIGKGVPIVVIAAGVIGRVVPAGNVESVNLRSLAGEE